MGWGRAGSGLGGDLPLGFGGLVGLLADGDGLGRVRGMFWSWPTYWRWVMAKPWRWCCQPSTAGRQRGTGRRRSNAVIGFWVGAGGAGEKRL